MKGDTSGKVMKAKLPPASIFCSAVRHGDNIEIDTRTGTGAASGRDLRHAVRRVRESASRAESFRDSAACGCAKVAGRHQLTRPVILPPTSQPFACYGTNDLRVASRSGEGPPPWISIGAGT